MDLLFAIIGFLFCLWAIWYAIHSDDPGAPVLVLYSSAGVGVTGIYILALLF